ncbi:MAG: hypothetical protein HY327_00465 [Chloroflexi bacterium]|nr:hypothetical protein [Chloroflexota bacterium]
MKMRVDGFETAREGRISFSDAHEMTSSLLDRFLPHYHIHELHSITIHAPASRSFRALHELTAREIWLTRPLFFLRSLPARLKGKRGFARFDDAPLLTQIARENFVLLGEEADRELVLGTIGKFWQSAGGMQRFRNAEEFVAFNTPGFAKATMNFHVSEAGGVTRLTTETRIVCTDAEARKKFARYWRLIYPGSALIRVIWLRAIRKRAEQTQE